jgi:hypothetical protein
MTSVRVFAVGDSLDEVRRFTDIFVSIPGDAVIHHRVAATPDVRPSDVDAAITPPPGVADDQPWEPMCVVVAIAHLRDGPADACAKAGWLNEVSADFWRILYIAADTTAPLDGDTVRGILDSLQAVQDDGTLMVRVAPDATRCVCPTQAFHAVACLVGDDVRPPTPAPSGPLVLRRPVPWAFTVIGATQMAANHMANILCEEPWMGYADVKSLEVRAILWEHGGHIVDEFCQRRPKYVNYALEDQAACEGLVFEPVVAAVEVCEPGGKPNALFEWCQRNTARLAHTLVYWLLPDSMDVVAVDFFTANLWLDRTRLARRPLRYVFKTRTELLPAIWADAHELAARDP